MIIKWDDWERQEWEISNSQHTKINNVRSYKSCGQNYTSNTLFWSMFSASAALLSHPTVSDTLNTESL